MPWVVCKGASVGFIRRSPLHFVASSQSSPLKITGNGILFSLRIFTAFGIVFLPLFGNVTLFSLSAAAIWMAVQSLLNRIWTGIFTNYSATLLLRATFPVSSTLTYMAACGADGVTRILNSSSDILFRSNMVFLLFLYFGAELLHSNGAFSGSSAASTSGLDRSA